MDTAHQQAYYVDAAAAISAKPQIMDSYITLQDIANIVLFVMPGYFAIRSYALVYAKNDKDFAKLLIECAVFSLVIVSIFNYGWHHLLHKQLTEVTNAAYVMALLLFSLVLGWLFAYMRDKRPVRWLCQLLRLPEPDEDFMRAQFKKLRPAESVAITLKNGEVFSGTPQGGNTFRVGYPRQYYFNNLAWYNKTSKKWEEREGSLIIDLSEVQYIETDKPLTRD